MGGLGPQFSLKHALAVAPGCNAIDASKLFKHVFSITRQYWIYDMDFLPDTGRKILNKLWSSQELQFMLQYIIDCVGWSIYAHFRLIQTCKIEFPGFSWLNYLCRSSRFSTLLCDVVTSPVGQILHATPAALNKYSAELKQNEREPWHFTCWVSSRNR